MNSTANRAALYAARATADRVQPGDTLTNGATVVAAQYLGQGWAILALWGRQYVTWTANRTDPHGSTGSGHYFGGANLGPLDRVQALAEAVADYRARCGLADPASPWARLAELAEEVPA